ncbi:recombination regulator RecX [Pasteurellaceae bacterium LFhippo2]|nr:recombination regulator RecX [Pasteurellaceae bacterium LFhippo2]
MTHKYTALNYVVYLLSKRDYSELELRRKLKLKEYESDEIDKAIEQAQQHNWQSDERFCRAYARYRANQGYGPLRVKQELKQRGVKDWIISQEIAILEEEGDIDWFDIAEQLFEKKRPYQWDIKAKQKMWRYMVSHGFYNDHFSHLLDVDYNDYD